MKRTLLLNLVGLLITGCFGHTSIKNTATERALPVERTPPTEQAKPVEKTPPVEETDSSFAPEEQIGIQKELGILNEVLKLYAEEALERPKNLALCVNEMIQMHRTGDCRDRFSHYETAEETKITNTDLSGEFSGIGAELQMRDNYVTVVAPLPNTPAERAGLKPGDVIIKVDGKETGGLIKTVTMIRGLQGTPVTLTILRQGLNEPFEVTLIREKIKTAPVTSKIAPGHPDIGIIKVTEFVGNTLKEFVEALSDLHKQKVKKVVIDLRNNPGGLLDTALGILSLFGKNSQDTLIAVRTRAGTEKITIADSGWQAVSGTEMIKNLRVVVLINGGSASASEIFAGTMKDWGYPIVGEKSFGKGVGQTIFDLSDGSSLILTTFEFLVGNSLTPIRDKGVVPDVEVKQPADAKKDVQMKKAVGILQETP